MNVVLIMSDTYRWDNLSCYGPTEVKTPRLDQFAAESHVFKNAYLGSFPTIPNRLDIMSGRFSFIDHEWCPLPADLVSLQQILSASNITTQMIVDNPHLIEMGFNYERGFDAWEWIRGQETDRWQNLPKEPVMPSGGDKNRTHWVLKNYLRNTGWWKSEEDRFVARTVRAAETWLERVSTQPGNFFLYVDLFDPHEPWDAPQHYLDLYQKAYTGPEIMMPQYDFWRDFMNEDELRHVLALYRAEASMVDHWVGELIAKIDELGMGEDTAVIFTSDHGYLFGEHELTGKSRLPLINGKKFYESVPMYDEIRRVPLMIRLPGQTKGQQHDALVQSPDLMPTILELAGLVSTETIGGQAEIQALQCGVFYTSDWKFDPKLSHGKSLMPVMRGDTRRVRDIAVSSATLIHHTPVLAKCSVVTEDGWCLHYSGCYDEVESGGTTYTSKLLENSAARLPTAPALYHLPGDRAESNNVIEANDALAAEIHHRYVRWLEEAGTPEQYLSGRRRLR